MKMEMIMRTFIVIHIPTREFPANSDTSHSMMASANLGSDSGKAALATGKFRRSTSGSLMSDDGGGDMGGRSPVATEPTWP